MHEKQKPLTARVGPSLCSHDNEFLFVTGGSHQGTCLDTCEEYSILDDTWTSGPSLNTARAHHSSCTLERYIYVFCGQKSLENDQASYLGSIERLDARAWLTGDSSTTWELINLKSNALTENPRSYPLVKPIKKDLIAILGGKDAEKGHLGNGYYYKL